MYIHELQLATPQLEQQRDFYTRVLELPVQSANTERLTLTVGTSKLIFSATSQPPPLTYHFAFNIPAAQFAVAKQWLAARVALISDPQGNDAFHFANWNAQSIYFNDPAGNICELIARHDLPSQPADDFSGASLLNISEIGLAVDDVPQTVQNLQRSTGIAVYRDTVDEQFTPLGDENGLLIVVKRGRKWFPAGTVAATALPLSVLISTSTSTRYWIEHPSYTARLAQA